MLKLGNVSGKTLFSAPTSQILKLEGLKCPPHLADYEDMLSLQWVTAVQKICPTDGLWVSWPAQLVLHGKATLLINRSLLRPRPSPPHSQPPKAQDVTL